VNKEFEILRTSVRIKILAVMTQKDLNYWIMYHETHRLSRLGFNPSKIASYMGIDARTVCKYLDMDEAQYEQHLIRLSQRKKILSPYEDFVATRLSQFKDTSAAQMHDWLKESHIDFPEVSPRTVYNFVMFVRQKHNIPYEHPVRDYFPVEELPYGEQAQVDFGEYNLRQPSGKGKKVYFFVMVLSRSRMKYVWFINKPFTAQSVVEAHEKAFSFFSGIPQTIVYDQDRTMVVDENLGDVILTHDFKQYTRSRSFNLHFCRKADPESKGKVENVVQYVKKNFLYNRVYHEIENLNTEAVAWLGRTANYLPHNTTKKSPADEFRTEQKHLSPYFPMAIEHENTKTYVVRKDNTVNYKGNFYTLPEGTYNSDDARVLIKEKDGILYIRSTDQQLITTHPVCLSRGKQIRNNNHKRDHSIKLKELMATIAGEFSDRDMALKYFSQIRKQYPRYIRDHLQAIKKSLANTSTATADKTLKFCLDNHIFNGTEWQYVLVVFDCETAQQSIKTDISLLDQNNLVKATQSPQTSNIEDYDQLFN
jgi:transposase